MGFYAMEELSNYIVDENGELKYSYFMESYNKWQEQFMIALQGLFDALKSVDDGQTEDI